jgi:hypothetical protein
MEHGASMHDLRIKDDDFAYHVGKSYTGWWCNNHLEKYEFVNGKDDIPYIMENNPVMFETTNQL